MSFLPTTSPYFASVESPTAPSQTSGSPEYDSERPLKKHRSDPKCLPPSSPDTPNGDAHQEVDQLPDLDELFAPIVSLAQSIQPTIDRNVVTQTDLRLSPGDNRVVGHSEHRTTVELPAQCIRNLSNISTINLHNDQIPKPRASTSHRLARFLHFNRSRPVNELAMTNMNTRADQPSEEQLQIRQRLIANKPSSVIRWEQARAIWEPGFEDPYQPDQSLGPIQVTDNETSSDEDRSIESQKTSPTTITQKSRRHPKKSNRTQLEKQWSEFKEQYPDLMILMEVGYKIRLFGTDAIQASRVLQIGHLALPGHETAFFPKTKLKVHLERLIMAGFKVGLFSQAETRSLKTGQTKTLFKRHLSQVYSLATWTENCLDHYESSTHQGNSNVEASLQTWVISLYENLFDPNTNKIHGNQPQMAFVALCPQNGDIIWDSWNDDHSYSKLEAIMIYFKPLEIVIPLRGLNPRSEKLINWMITHELESSTRKTRIEAIERHFDTREAYQWVNQFCQPIKTKSTQGDQLDSSASSTGIELLQHIIELPDNVLIALADLIVHMKSYGLESVFRQSDSFRSFSNQTHMSLDANTLRNLEIFQNSTDGTERGSLLWILDRTKTAMGKRLLKEWLGRPLIDLKMLQERADAVHEVAMNQNHIMILRMNRILSSRLPDLEKCLMRIRYGRCTPKELLRFLDVMDQISDNFIHYSNRNRLFSSNVLQEIFMSFNQIGEQILQLRSELNGSAILRGENREMFVNADERYPHITELNDCLSCVDAELNAHLESCRGLLQNPKLQYVTIGSDDYLLEVRISNLSRVPPTWIRFNNTRVVHRFRSPESQRFKEERDKYRDLLEETVKRCFLSFLRSIEEDEYESFKRVINKIGLIDCIISISKISLQNGYCQPILVKDPMIELRKARHPIVEQLIDDPLVDNDICLNHDQISSLILTGNNMGGKSVTSKMIGCIVILAQIGSYVPAESAKIGIFDGIYSRIGMFEDLRRGRSSFMIEMLETCKILKNVSFRSLVIFDELGYGTSTFDGLSISFSVLHDLVSRVGCFTLFITHYPQLNEISIKYPQKVKTCQMKFLETKDLNGNIIDITNLYKLIDGTSQRSYGIEIMNKMNIQIPIEVIRNARLKSDGFEFQMNYLNQIKRMNRIKCLLKYLKQPDLSNHKDILKLARQINDIRLSSIFNDES